MKGVFAALALLVSLCLPARADTLSPRFGFTIPTVGSTGWGVKLNTGVITLVDLNVGGLSIWNDWIGTNTVTNGWYYQGQNAALFMQPYLAYTSTWNAAGFNEFYGVTAATVTASVSMTAPFFHGEADTTAAFSVTPTPCGSGYVSRGVDASGNCLTAFVDTTPTSGSSDTVTSGGVFTGLAGKQATGNYITALTGDVLANGPGSVAATLKTQNTTAGTCGTATAVCQPTYNAKGIATDTNTVTITPDMTQAINTLAYGHGGTNATTSWTLGSIFFAGVSAFTQDNAKLFWDDSNFRLGLGTAAPTDTLSVVGYGNFTSGVKYNTVVGTNGGLTSGQTMCGGTWNNGIYTGGTACTAGPGSGSSTWTKYTKTYSDFSTGATSNSITLFTAAAGTIVEGVVIKQSTAFSGTSISAYTVSVGTTGVNDAYATAFDVFQAVDNRAFQTSMNFTSENLGATWAVTATATSTGANLNAASGAGSVDIWVKTSTLP